MDKASRVGGAERRQEVDSRSSTDQLVAEPQKADNASTPVISPRHRPTPPTVKSSPAPRRSPDVGDAVSKAPSPAAPPKKKGEKKVEKKGAGSTAKRGSKRPKNGETKRPKKANKSGRTARGADEASADGESDNGPYCICRGPDDHRWMICCENCEDWFHGECVHISKDVGEALIERFVCPGCSKGNLVTIYKKTCALATCRKPARLAQDAASVFCSNEHAHTWWERLVGRIPKSRAKAGLRDEMTQEEFVALLRSGLGSVGEDGRWRPSRKAFCEGLPGQAAGKDLDDGLASILNDEEKAFLENAAKTHAKLAEETQLCHQMLALTELAQERRRAAISAGRFSEDICGYDSRLDTVSARDAFAAFIQSPEGQSILGEAALGDPMGEGDEVRGMCDRKRCKVHSGWHKMLVVAVKYQIREMASQDAEVEERERTMKEAAAERWKRRQAEGNWLEVVEDE